MILGLRFAAADSIYGHPRHRVPGTLLSSYEHWNILKGTQLGFLDMFLGDMVKELKNGRVRVAAPIPSTLEDGIIGRLRNRVRHRQTRQTCYQPRYLRVVRDQIPIWTNQSLRLFVGTALRITLPGSNSSLTQLNVCF